MSSQLDSLKTWAPRTPARWGHGAMASTVAITSGKGGVGKSHVSLSVGMALADRGLKVLLIDGDMGLANLHILCGRYPERDVGDVLAGRCSLPDALMTLEERLFLLPAASGIANLSALPAADVSRLGNALAQLHTSVDVVLVDTGAGIGDTTMNLVLSADRVLLVTTPEPTAQADAYALLKVLRSRRQDLPVGLCLNMVHDQNQANDSALRLSQVAQRFLQTDLALDGWIARQEGLDTHILRRQPAFRADPQGLFAQGIVRLTESLLPLLPQAQEGGFFRRLGQTTTPIASSSGNPS